MARLTTSCHPDVPRGLNSGGSSGASLVSSRTVVTLSVIILLLSISVGLWLIDGRFALLQARTPSQPRAVPIDSTPPPKSEGSNGVPLAELEGNSTSATTEPLEHETVPPTTPHPPSATTERRTLAVPQRAVTSDGIGSPRLRLRSSMRSVPWTSDDEARKARALGFVLASCGSGPRWEMRGDDSSGGGNDANQSGVAVTVGTSMRRMHLVGHHDLECGRWTRFWVVALCRNVSTATADAGGSSAQGNGDGLVSWTPCCGGRDKIEVQMEAPDAKVSAERLYEIDHGVYEVQVFIRKCSARYVIGVDLIASNSALEWLLNSDQPRNLTAELLNVSRAEERRAVCHKKLFYPKSVMFVNVSVTSGVDVVPINRRCDDAAEFRSQPLDLRDRFRYGSWYRLPGGVCDGVHCDGDTGEWKTNGWVWVPDLCRVQLYNRQGVQAILLGRKLFSWGTSLLHQPTTNLLYYHVSEHVRLVPRGRGYDFSFERRRALPIQVAFRSATCVVPVIRKADCANKSGEPIGFPTWRIAQNDFLKMIPHFVLIDRASWIPDPVDEIQYLRDLEQWIQTFRIEGLKSLPRKPMYVLMLGTTATENSINVRPCGNSIGAVQAHRGWLVEDLIVANHSDVFSLVSRYDMTFPLHFGVEFVHGTSHYGSSAFLCSFNWRIRAGKNSAYQRSNCVRKLHGDEALLLAWLNIFNTPGLATTPNNNLSASPP